MVETQLRPRGISDARVLNAFLRVPREDFFPDELRSFAYEDAAFPIGGAQTVSQPYMVAIMTELLKLKGDEKVLEVGTGSGYQAAVLSALSHRVYTIERIVPLARKAREVVDDLGIANVDILVGDGSRGWPERGPFDRILTTAAAGEVPASLLAQLREGGFFLGPVYNGSGEQEIIRLTRAGQEFRLERLRKCSFVPLVRGRPEGENAAKDTG